MQEIATLERYKRAAKKPEKALCCPVSYQRPELLKIIPQEILEVDYGCGDPTVYVREGEVVVDLGSGSGKHVYMMAQIVGPKGKVIGVDFNKEMLSLARKYQDEIAKKLGYKNTKFYYAKIQNLKLDLEKVEAYLQTNPIKTAEDLIVFENYVKKLEEKEPLIPDESVDTVVSNCVLNLVKPEDKDRLFSEIYRVLKIGGRAVISDIVSDEDVPPHLQEDPELWSGCIAGALREDKFIQAFLKAGFSSVRVLKWEEKPWQVIEGIEFRSITIEAIKGEKGPCIDAGHAVIYLGPFYKVEDTEGHVFEIGKRVAVCERTFRNLKRAFSEHFIFIEPAKPLPKRPFPNCTGMVLRSPKETKEGKREIGIPFEERLKSLGVELKKRKISIVQVNIGNLCNMSCRHCHHSASPNGKLMPNEILHKIAMLLKKNPGLSLDLTGGAPELHPYILPFLKEVKELCREIWFRSNLTALADKPDLMEELAKLGVKIIASFPSINKKEAEGIRGHGFYAKALEVLKSLNELGYGKDIPLILMVNPTKPELVKSSFELKSEFEAILKEKHGISFSDLFVLNNAPIGRYRKLLSKKGLLLDYEKLLEANFNPSTLDKLMCLDLITIGPDGMVYDCDFNLALNLPVDGKLSVDSLLTYGLEVLEDKNIKVGNHCYVCTAQFGTSCFGCLC
jgi:radical SAM/Cys-rich protein